MTNLLIRYIRQSDRGLELSTYRRRTSLIGVKILEVAETVSVLIGRISIKGLVVTGMLLLLVLFSALGVVYSSHLSRQLFAEQAVLLERNDQIHLEWAQLLLEQSAWSSPNRIERIASDKLGMAIPEAEAIKLIY